MKPTHTKKAYVQTNVQQIFQFSWQHTDTYNFARRETFTKAKNSKLNGLNKLEFVNNCFDGHK